MLNTRAFCCHRYAWCFWTSGRWRLHWIPPPGARFEPITCLVSSQVQMRVRAQPLGFSAVRCEEGWTKKRKKESSAQVPLLRKFGKSRWEGWVVRGDSEINVCTTLPHWSFDQCLTWQPLVGSATWNHPLMFLHSIDAITLTLHNVTSSPLIFHYLPTLPQYNHLLKK